MTLVEIVGFLGMTAGGLLIGAWGGFKSHTKMLLVGIMSFGLLADRTSMRLQMVVFGILLMLIAVVMCFDKSFYRHGKEC